MTRRLCRYLRWLRAAFLRTGGYGVIALCRGQAGQAQGWSGFLAALSEDIGLETGASGPDLLGPGYVVVWLWSRRALAFPLWTTGSPTGKEMPIRSSHSVGGTACQTRRPCVSALTWSA
jgi:hypothetical protein